MAQLNIRVDDSVKEHAEALFNRMCLTMSAAVTLFLHQVIQHNAIPFTITAGDDPLYNPTMTARIKESIEQFKQGNYIEKSMEEMERMADE